MRVKLNVSHRTGSGWKGPGETVTLQPSLAEAMILRAEATAADDEPHAKATAAPSNALVSESDHEPHPEPEPEHKNMKTRRPKADKGA